jgi:hypothetical protein
MVSTFHTAETADVPYQRADIMKVKPECVTDYNIYAHGMEKGSFTMVTHPHALLKIM